MLTSNPGGHPHVWALNSSYFFGSGIFSVHLCSKSRCIYEIQADISHSFSFCKQYCFVLFLASICNYPAYLSLVTLISRLDYWYSELQNLICIMLYSFCFAFCLLSSVKLDIRNSDSYLTGISWKSLRIFAVFSIFIAQWLCRWFPTLFVSIHCRKLMNSVNIFVAINHHIRCCE